MERRDQEETTELCVLCGEEVDLLDTSSHARVRGRTVCRQCSQKLGGVYNPQTESWTRQPVLPEALKPRKD